MERFDVASTSLTRYRCLTCYRSGWDWPTHPNVPNFAPNGARCRTKSGHVSGLQPLFGCCKPPHSMRGFMTWHQFNLAQGE